MITVSYMVKKYFNYPLLIIFPNNQISVSYKFKNILLNSNILLTTIYSQNAKVDLTTLVHQKYLFPLSINCFQKPSSLSNDRRVPKGNNNLIRGKLFRFRIYI